VRLYRGGPAAVTHSERAQRRRIHEARSVTDGAQSHFLLALAVHHSSLPSEVSSQQSATAV